MAAVSPQGCGDIPAWPGDSTCCWGLLWVGEATRGSHPLRNAGLGPGNDFCGCFPFQMMDFHPGRSCSPPARPSRKRGLFAAWGGHLALASASGCPGDTARLRWPLQELEGSLDRARLCVTPTAHGRVTSGAQAGLSQHLQHPRVLEERQEGRNEEEGICLER